MQVPFKKWAEPVKDVGRLRRGQGYFRLDSLEDFLQELVVNVEGIQGIAWIDVLLWEMADNGVIRLGHRMAEEEKWKVDWGYIMYSLKEAKIDFVQEAVLGVVWE